MLNINNNKLKKSQIPLLLICIGLGGVFLFQYLTFIPEYSYADSISTAPTDNRTLEDISTMQEMTPDICYNTNPGASKQLEDIRDHKTYWVARLADGNCWMTQNLDLDLSTETTLTPKDSDVSRNWTPNNTTINVGETHKNPTKWDMTVPGWQSDSDNYNIVQSYDPGVYIFPSTGTTAPAVGSPNTTNLDKNTTQDPDAHYLLGNYYSFNAATAGTGERVTDDDIYGTNPATDSICPKGWRLPTSGSNNGLSTDSTNGSFGYMLVKENVVASDSASASTMRTNLYFIFGGLINDNNALGKVGSNGYYWSSTPNSNRWAYYLSIYSSYVSPASHNNRYNGRPVRCLTIAQKTTLDDLNVSVTIKPVLTLELKNNSVVIDTELNRINTGEFTAIVSSSTAYTLSLSSDVPALTNNTSTSDITIPSISNTPTSITSQIEPGTNMWGIRTCNRTSSSTGVENAGGIEDNCPTNPLTYADSKQATNPYLGITTNLTKYAESELGVYEQPTLFQVGIGIAPNLPAGTYQTNVTVTASQK